MATRVASCIGTVLVTFVATAGAEPPAPPAQPAFQPGEISIGEPIPLPYAGSGAAGDGTPATPPGDDPRAAGPAATPATGAVPGSGWLGLAVAESTVPGRWRVEEVTAGGPADRAGIAVGDELRAVNGSTLSSAEEVSQSLTAIAAGQDVRVAVARGERVTDVVLRAETRPAARPAPATAATEPPAFAAPPPPARSAPSTEPARDAWQSAPPRPAGGADAVALGGQQATASDLVSPPVTTAAAPPGDRHAVAPAPAAPVPGPFVPPDAALPAARAAAGRPALGVRTVPIDPALQARFNLAEPTGAYVVGVVHDLPAGKAGVPPGSVIVALGEQPVRSPLELTKLVSSGPLDRPVSVQFVLPGGEAKRAAVVLQPIDASLERVLAGETAAPPTPAAEQSAPVARRVERPADEGAVIRQEIRLLRERLERLERLLAPAPRGAR